MADEDDDAQALDSERDGDEREDAGSESEGATGEDSAGRDEDNEGSTQRAGDEGDEGAPQKGRAAVDEAEPRRSDRYQRLANENRDLRERMDRAERERENERQQWQRQQQQLNDQQERERLNLMTPEERAEYRVNQHEQRTNARLQQSELRMLMQMDKSAYDAKAASNPVYRRMQEAVEQRFSEQSRIGQPTDRETILKFLLGEQALNGAATAGKQRRAATRRVENERVRPAAGKSSATPPVRKMSTAEERLKDVII